MTPEQKGRIGLGFAVVCVTGLVLAAVFYSQFLDRQGEKILKDDMDLLER